jgi:hypothetical protein
MGPLYRSEGGIIGRRVLILGWSTYKEEEHLRAQHGHWINVELPCGQIQQSFAGGKFPAGVFRAFLGSRNETSPGHVQSFWQSVIFFNYIIPALERVGRKPTRAEWSQHQPLVAIVESQRPHLVVVVGIGLWDGLGSTLLRPGEYIPKVSAERASRL